MDWSSELHHRSNGVRDSAVLGNRTYFCPGIRASRRRGPGAGTPGARRGAEKRGFLGAAAEYAHFRGPAPAAPLARDREATIPGRKARQIPRSDDSRTRNSAFPEKRHFRDTNCHGSGIRPFSAIGRIPVREDGLLGSSASEPSRRGRGEAPRSADSLALPPNTRISEAPPQPPLSPDAEKRRFLDAKLKVSREAPFCGRKTPSREGTARGGGGFRQPGEKRRQSCISARSASWRSPRQAGLHRRQRDRWRSHRQRQRRSSLASAETRRQRRCSGRP